MTTVAFKIVLVANGRTMIAAPPQVAGRNEDLLLGPDDDRPPQRWRLVHISGDIFKISLDGTDLVLDTSSQKAAGSRIQLRPDNGQVTQHWTLGRFGPFLDQYRIISADSGNLLEIAPVNINLDGAAVVQGTFNISSSATTQLWQFVVVETANSSFTITSRATGKVLDVPSANPNDGVQIQQFTNNGGRNQLWHFLRQSNGLFSIASVATGKVLDVPSADPRDGVQIQQFTRNNQPNQSWRLSLFQAAPIHTFIITSGATGKVLDVPSANPNDGIHIQQFTRNSQPNQEWELQASATS